MLCFVYKQLIGDVHAHSTLWHSYTDDHRGQLIADVISNITLNTNTPTRVPNISTRYNHGVKYAIQLDIVDNSTRTIIIITINIRHEYILQQNRRTFTNYKTGHNSQKSQSHRVTESTFAQTTIPTNIHTVNIIFTNSILMADKHIIPKGKMNSNCKLLPEYIYRNIIRNRPVSGLYYKLSISL